jgi:HTH-type transcriptional regulator, transcriptional repressor of NAD biosynthesis genes
MKTGLVLGKFSPLHSGHIGLIEFAAVQCDRLYTLVCASDKEKISGTERLNWIKETFAHNTNVVPVLLNYREDELPNTSVSSRDVAKAWSERIKIVFPQVDIIFSSEKYGDYMAEYLSCRHIKYDLERTKAPVSASEILQHPFENWHYIADAAKPYFVKKVCIYGTESTGKSTLTALLARHFKTNFVPEMAREIIQETDECTGEHLQQIAVLHAKTITSKIKSANKILFVDTDINITRSYSKYLFGKELQVPHWVEAANTYSLHIFLNNDASFVQDGTRLDKERRDILHEFHKRELAERNIFFEMVSGNWDERFAKSVQLVERLLTG